MLKWLIKYFKKQKNYSPIDLNPICENCECSKCELQCTMGECDVCALCVKIESRSDCPYFIERRD